MDCGAILMEMLMLESCSKELGDQRRRSRASPNPWLIGQCFDAVIDSKSFIGYLCCSGK
jgi:hypothetical protein